MTNPVPPHRPTAPPDAVARLHSWMTGKEGETTEFKEAKNDFDLEKLTRYCCALANEGGGRVVLGVTDRRPRRVVGSRAFPQPEETRTTLCRRLRLRLDFEEITHPDCSPGTRVLVFLVPPRPVATPVVYDAQYWAREQDSLAGMTGDRLRANFAESGHDFSADVCAAAAADLDPLAVEDYRRRWVDKLRKMENTPLAERVAALPPNDLLADIGATADGAVTYAALVLFGTPAGVHRHLAQAELVFEYRSSDAAGPPQDREEYQRGFFGYYDQLWERVNRRNDRQDFQQGFFVAPIATFNERTVREAVLNAVCHRDYQLGGSVFLRQYPRRLELVSPGGLPAGVTVENILDKQLPRNRRIAELLARCGLVERSGQGMDLIYEELIRHGKPTPDFAQTDQYQVGLTLHGTVQDPAFVRFVERVGRQTTASFGTRDWLTLAAVARGEKVPKGLTGCVPRLLDLGLIERVAGRQFMLSRKYYEFVGDKPAYTRRRGLNRDQNLLLLLNHITDNAVAGSRLEDLCQVLTALPTSQVRSLLKSLRRQGRAHSVGNTKAARWYPGSGLKRPNPAQS